MRNFMGSFICNVRASVTFIKQYEENTLRLLRKVKECKVSGIHSRAQICTSEHTIIISMQNTAE